MVRRKDNLEDIMQYPRDALLIDSQSAGPTVDQRFGLVDPATTNNYRYAHWRRWRRYLHHRGRCGEDLCGEGSGGSRPGW